MSKIYCFLDVEATGLEPKHDQLIEIAIISVQKGEVIDTFYSLVKPTRSIPQEVSSLTGLGKKRLEKAPEFFQIAQDIFERINGNTIVAHNARFDSQILKAEFERIGLVPKCKTLCTYETSKHIIPGLNSYSLESLCQFFDIPYKNKHHALYDAEACKELFECLEEITKFRETPKKRYLPEHKKLIDQTLNVPGVITFKTNDQNKVFASGDLKKSLIDKLAMNAKNLETLQELVDVKTIPTGSYVLAQTRLAKLRAPNEWVAYTVKSKSGKIILRTGKFKNNFYYIKSFPNKKGLDQFVHSLLKELPSKKFISKDKKIDKGQVVKHNIYIKNKIKPFDFFDANYLIRSSETYKGNFTYILIRPGYRWGTFTNEKLLTGKEIEILKEVKLKKLSPQEKEAVSFALQALKGQKVKTDIVYQIKKIKKEKRHEHV